MGQNENIKKNFIMIVLLNEQAAMGQGGDHSAEAGWPWARPAVGECGGPYRSDREDWAT